MRVKAQLSTHLVNKISGTPSLVLANNCPDQLIVFPSEPCTNRGCAYAIKQNGYMNCTFVAAEAGEHTLDQIGEMMGITREGVRLIEKRGLRKLERALEEQEHVITALRQPNQSSGEDHVVPSRDVAELQNQGDSLRAVNGRKLEQRGG